MPDLDIIERKLRPGWRPAYNLVKGNQPTEEVARAIIKALAQCLREQGGQPQLHEVAQLVQLRDSGRLNGRSLADVAAKLEHGMTTLGGKLLAQAVLRPSLSDPASTLLQGPPDVRVAREYLVMRIQNELFAQQRDYLVGKCFPSRDAAIRYEANLLALMDSDLDGLARNLARDPSARSLRAPRRRAQGRRTTEALLKEPL